MKKQGALKLHVVFIFKQPILCAYKFSVFYKRVMEWTF